MAIILWLVVGLAVGWLASRVKRSPHGLQVDLLLGVIGALVCGLVFGNLVIAALGAAALLVLQRRFFPGRARGF
jgi:uncharacterized membrane protein YeaQ/YmgE (transglycosylase-associated protein family)